MRQKHGVQGTEEAKENSSERKSHCDRDKLWKEDLRNSKTGAV
jgi:hypothetical protein